MSPSPAVTRQGVRDSKSDTHNEDPTVNGMSLYKQEALRQSVTYSSESHDFFPILMSIWSENFLPPITTTSIKSCINSLRSQAQLTNTTFAFAESLTVPEHLLTSVTFAWKMAVQSSAPKFYSDGASPCSITASIAKATSDDALSIARNVSLMFRSFRYQPKTSLKPLIGQVEKIRFIQRDIVGKFHERPFTWAVDKLILEYHSCITLIPNLEDTTEWEAFSSLLHTKQTFKESQINLRFCRTYQTTQKYGEHTNKRDSKLHGAMATTSCTSPSPSTQAHKYPSSPPKTILFH
ncbi:hypothetical protein Cpir12675_004405 [Ceratocystis pirilliformis]|uniref:Uncharacterized protein n=1 Tax=Ceratocystis pirilliformis TaxID=259994 RepID=A0ABR3YWM9_9PEZI